MTDTITTQFKAEGDPAFPAADTENENSADSSTEKTDSDQTQPPDGKKEDSGVKKDDTDENFAAHPRWKQREDDWTKRFNDQETRSAASIGEAVNKVRDEFEKRLATREGAEDAQIPSWFGGDDTSWAEYKSHAANIVKSAVAQALETVESKSTEEQKRIDKATDFFKESVATIESDKAINPDGIKVDRNKLLKFVLDNELVDTQGRWNYRAGFKMMQANIVNTKTDEKDERKKIAEAVGSDKHSETKPSAFMTSKDFYKPENRPW